MKKIDEETLKGANLNYGTNLEFVYLYGEAPFLPIRFPEVITEHLRQNYFNNGRLTYCLRISLFGC